MENRNETYTPSRFVLETTLACNLRCRHCGSRAGKARTNELTTPEIKDLFEQASNLGCKRVTLSGGEPTMRPDWLELIAAARSNGLFVALITNGTTFTPQVARQAKEAGLCTVGLSVDGMGQTHDRVRGRIGHFQVMTEAMSASRRAGLSFTVITTLNRFNQSELIELHNLAIAKGAFSWQVQPTFNMGNMLDNPELPLRPKELVQVESLLAKLIKQKKQRMAVCNSFGYFGPNEKILRRSHNAPYFRGCAAGLRTFGIESNGDVKGCLSTMAGCHEDKSDFIEGNIREEPLSQIWNKPGAFAYNRNWSVDDLEGFCRDCKHVEQCRGGCRTNIVHSGRGVENPDCVYRAIVEQNSCPSVQRPGRAAAMVLATLLGASTQSCEKSSSPTLTGDTNTDAGSYSDGDAGMDEDDTGTDTDTGTDIDVDTDSDTDTDSYSDGDADTDGYDTDTDVDVDADTDADTDTDIDIDSGTDAAL